MSEKRWLPGQWIDPQDKRQHRDCPYYGGRRQDENGELITCTIEFGMCHEKYCSLPTEADVVVVEDYCPEPFEEEIMQGETYSSKPGKLAIITLPVDFEKVRVTIEKCP